MKMKKVVIPALFVAALVMDAAIWAQEGKAADDQPAQENASTQAIDQRALDALKLMSDTISGAKTVRFQTRSMVPFDMPNGMWINLYGASRVVMQAPGKLFVSTAGDFAPYELYFDGKTVTKYSPDKNLYAVKDLAGTIDDMIDKQYDEDGKSFPFADLLVSDPYDVMTENLITAQYVGRSILKPLSGAEGVMTDHLVFEQKGVMWQIWIGSDDHLPRLVVADYLDEASEPSYTSEFGDWKLNEPVDSSAFAFNNTKNALKIEYHNPTTQDEKTPGKAADDTVAEGGRS